MFSSRHSGERRYALGAGIRATGEELPEVQLGKRPTPLEQIQLLCIFSRERPSGADMDKRPKCCYEVPGFLEFRPFVRGEDDVGIPDAGFGRLAFEITEI